MFSCWCHPLTGQHEILESPPICALYFNQETLKRDTVNFIWTSPVLLIQFLFFTHKLTILCYSKAKFRERELQHLLPYCTERQLWPARERIIYFWIFLLLSYLEDHEFYAVPITNIVRYPHIGQACDPGCSCGPYWVPPFRTTPVLCYSWFFDIKTWI